MPQTKATDSLSDEARAVMARGCAEGRTAAWIVQAVADATGETVAPRTVARRAAEWRSEDARRKAARERMEDLVAAMRANDMDASEMIQALAMDHLVEHPEALTGADPIELHGMSLDAEKVRLKKRELDLRERAIAAVERKAKLLEDREERAKAALGDERQAMSPEERLAEIREIYGIRG